VHASEREQLILELVRERGFISFKELDKRVKGSPATLRRDLDRLETAGQITRVRGGAKAVTDNGMTSGHLSGVPFHENIDLHPAAKAAIGKAAAALCSPGEAILIDGGSTTLQMCPHLEALEPQVLTNSLHIVSALMPQTRTRISIPGGTVFREQNIVLNSYEDAGAGSYRASKMFLGAAAVGRHGLMQADILLLQSERRLMERADELILLVDSSKFHAPAGHVLCPLSDIDVLVTDDEITPEHQRMVEDAGVRLVVAPIPKVSVSVLPRARAGAGSNKPAAATRGVRRARR
jgi:DeoR family ulaG and ulaABCDEF operon transcriptional repressor